VLALREPQLPPQDTDAALTREAARDETFVA
jgi:hypothetical protein